MATRRDRDRGGRRGARDRSRGRRDDAPPARDTADTLVDDARPFEGEDIINAAIAAREEQVDQIEVRRAIRAGREARTQQAEAIASDKPAPKKEDKKPEAPPPSIGLTLNQMMAVLIAAILVGGGIFILGGLAIPAVGRPAVIGFRDQLTEWATRRPPRGYVSPQNEE